MNSINEYLSYLFESINKDLESYIQKNIIPMYKKFDLGHSISHAQSVIDFSLRLQKLIKNTNIDMVYTIAAYHDTGLSKGRKSHNIDSGKIVRNDKKLKHFFNDKDIEIIAQACEDHRASSKNPPRSIYGKIVGDADRSDSVILEKLILRVWLYRIGNSSYNNLSDEELFDDMYKHMNNKYGEKGYAKYHLSETKRLLNKSINRTRRILKSKEDTYKIFLKMRRVGILKRT